MSHFGATLGTFWDELHELFALLHVLVQNVGNKDKGFSHNHGQSITKQKILELHAYY